MKTNTTKSTTYNKSLFLNNKYTDCYYRILLKAKTKIIQEDLYFEIHHIIPRSIGGNEDAPNKIKLTAREHFLCHKLLIKMTEGMNKRKMIWAIQRFINRNKKQKTIRITSRQYEYIRKLYCINHPMKEDSNKNRVKESQFAKYGNYAFISKETLARQKKKSIKKYGLPYAFMSNIVTKQNNDMILTCPHCNKTGKTLAAMKRWHFDNCRL